MSSQELNRQREVKKHVAAIHISNSFTLLQRKAANVLLLNAYGNLLSKEIHRIKIIDLAHLIGFESHNREALKDALRGLMSTVVEWNLLDEQGNDDGWEASTMLASVRCRRGYCDYSYSPALRDKLYNPEIYASINLGIQRKLSSGYALALYENCVRYRNTKSTGWISLELYRKLMGVQDDKYHDFKRFAARVIRDPVQQVNQSSDIFLEYDYKREKRKVVSVRFKIEDNPQLLLFAGKVPSGIAAPSNCRENLEPPDEAMEQLCGRLLELGLSVAQAKRVLANHEVAYVQDVLKVVERDYLAGKIENLPAYTVAAIKDDYRNRLLPVEITEVSPASAVETAQEQRRESACRQLEHLSREFEKEKLQHALECLSAADRASLEERFLEAHKDNLAFRKWLKRGFQHVAVQSLFRVFASKELLAATEESEFADFVAARGYELAVLKREATDTVKLTGRGVQPT